MVSFYAKIVINDFIERVSTIAFAVVIQHTGCTKEISLVDFVGSRDFEAVWGDFDQEITRNGDHVDGLVVKVDFCDADHIRQAIEVVTRAVIDADQ